VRNPGVQTQADQSADASATRHRPEGLMVDVVVLSDDVALYQAIRDAVGERNPVWRARTAAESVDLLLTGRCGVLLFDMGAVATQPASLIEQIVDQFPDVIVVVAGRRDDEALLAQLVSDGHVYRFMHKPLSPKRAGMFLDAAIRCHVERSDGRARERRVPQVSSPRARLDPFKWLFVGGGLVLFVSLLGTVLVARRPDAPASSSAPVAHPAQPAVAAAPGPRADPVLSRARAAQAAGRYEAPPGRNAVDLYAAVLLARPDNAEARVGLAAVSAALIERAAAAADAGEEIEARRLAGRVLGADAGHAGARALLARLERPAVATAPAVAAATTAPAQRTTPPTAPSAPATPAAARAAAHDPAPATVAPQRMPAVAARPAPIRRANVPLDPLTPRLVGPRPAPTRGGGQHSYGAPITSGQAVAGYARQGTTDTTPSAEDLPAPGATGVAAAAGPAARELTAIATPDPVYPSRAFRDRVEGWVEVEFTVSEQGVTDDIVVVAAEPRGEFEAAASEAVAAWRYLPRVVNGRPVAQRSSVTVRFSVED